ncbi:MAG: DUF5662 family protein [Candidatus Woesearchaeota archaeon]
MYWKYFLYVVNHKKNVFIECWKMGLYIHAFTHDLSKFLPSEFIPYARFFYSTNRYNNYKKSDEDNENFQMGWCFHQKRNKHHWNYWVSITRKNEIIPIPMPKKYVLQMIADWNGMSRKFGGTTKEYFENNKHKMILHDETIKTIESILYKN